MPAEENAGEHGHPKPGPGNDGEEGAKADEEEAGVCGEDFAGKLEDGDGFGEGAAAAVNADCPDAGEDGGDEGEPAHCFVLDAGTVPLTAEAGDKGVEGEREEDYGDGYEHCVD